MAEPKTPSVNHNEFLASTARRSNKALWCLATSLLTALTGSFRDAQSVHQHPPHVTVDRIDGRVRPLGGVDWVVEPGRGEQHRPAGGHGIDGAERAFLHAGPDDRRAQRDQFI